jgi:hypothetical protein
MISPVIFGFCLVVGTVAIAEERFRPLGIDRPVLSCRDLVRQAWGCPVLPVLAARKRTRELVIGSIGQTKDLAE